MSMPSIGWKRNLVCVPVAIIAVSALMDSTASPGSSSPLSVAIRIA